MDRAKLSTAIWLAIMSVVWMIGSLAIYLNTAVDNLILFALVLVEFIWIVSAGVTWAYWIVDRGIELDMGFRRSQSITPMTEAANTIMRLTKEQLDFLKVNGYYMTVGVLGTENGPLKVLLTPRGNIPWNAVERELRLSTVLGLRAIRETSDGSPEREWRRLFTAYCVDQGLAIEAEGPYSARWLDKTSRMILAGRLGIVLYGTGDNGNGEGDNGE
jgi:hypothetical protein